MSDAAIMADSHEIVVDEVFPHTPEVVWKTLTTAELIGRWLMTPTGFEPTKGKHFTYQTKPAGEWDGVIHCQVLEVTPNERLVYAYEMHLDDNRISVSLSTIELRDGRVLVTLGHAVIAGRHRLELVHLVERPDDLIEDVRAFGRTFGPSPSTPSPVPHVQPV